MHPLSFSRPARTVALFAAALLAVLATLVSTASATVGAYPTTVATNPDLKPACGTNVVMVLDESGSIQGTAGAEEAVRSAANAFANGLADTGSKLAVIEFGSSAKKVFPYTSVTSGAGGTLATTFQPYFNRTASAPADVYDSPSQTGPWTNWEDALQEVKNLNSTSGVAPLVVFITDGDPTATGTVAPFATNVASATALTPAIVQANAVKAQGSHILAVGVGAALSNAASLARLSAISGTDVVSNPASLNLATTDVLAVSNFANLPTALRTIVNQLCKRSMAVTKSVDQPVVIAGTPVTYTIRVTNTGDVALTNVAVADIVTPACVKSIGSLAVGAFFQYTCPATINQDTTNMATATATDPLGASLPPVSAEAVVDVIAPSLSITKSVDTPTVVAPADVTWTVQVTNTGNAVLTNVAVTDADAPGCDMVIGTLAAHAAAAPITCTTTITKATTNTAVVVGEDQLGNTVAPDPAQATVDVVTSGLTVTKTVDKPVVLANETVTWTVLVENTGDVALTGVNVSDALAPGCDTLIGPLAAHTAATPISCTSTITALTTNVAVAIGTDPFGHTVEASDHATVNVIHPDFVVTKTVDAPVVLAGTQVTWKVNVTNIGDVPLSNVMVTDPLAPACSGAIPTIALGATETVTCTSVITANTDNIASVTPHYAISGQDQALPAKSAHAAVAVIAPNLTLVKTVDKPEVIAGSQVVFTITLTNSGDAAINDIVLSDPLAPGCSKPIGTLAPGVTVTVNCTETINTTMTNVATVTGVDPLTNTLTRTASAEVKVTGTPNIAIAGSSQTTLRIDKRGPSSAKAGQVITYRIKITNSGKLTALNVIVRDRLPGGMALAAKSEGVQLVKGVITITIGDLAPGASKTLLVKARIDRTALGARTNVATASASNALQVRDTARTKVVRIGGRVRIPIVTG